MSLHIGKAEREFNMGNNTNLPKMPKPGQKTALYTRFANTPHDTLEKSKTAIYCRTASTHPNDFMAIWVQRDKLRAFAHEQGLPVIKEYTDDGFSGNNLNRPAFIEMEADIAAGKIDTIIVSCINRIARDVFLMEDWMSKARAMGVLIIALNGSHEPPPPLFLKDIRALILGKKRRAI